MMNIFLSHAHEDRAAAEEICYALRSSGYRVFFDRDLPPGRDYHSRIRQAIEQSDAYVFVVSPHSIVKGGYVLTELTWAKQKWQNPSGRVLPVVVKPTDLHAVDKYLTSVTVLEPAGNAAAEVVANLDRLLRPATNTAALLTELSFDRLSKASRSEINDIMNRFQTVITTNPADGLAHYGIALLHLHAGRYEPASEHFKRAVELLPENPDAHYYYGLSLIRGRRPRTLSLKEIRRIEGCLQAATQLDDKSAKYYYLAAILKYDYYLANGLACTPPSPGELISMARRQTRDPWEIERLLRSVTLRDETLMTSIRGR